MKALALLLLVSACTAEQWSKQAAEKAGFTDVEAGGYAWFACGKDDEFATKFRGTNVNGQRVEGAVCCGLMKNCTVRF